MKRLEEVMVAAKDAATAANKQMELIANEKSALEAALNQQEKKLEKLSLEVCVHRAHMHHMHAHAHAHAHRAGRLRTYTLCMAYTPSGTRCTSRTLTLTLTLTPTCRWRTSARRPPICARTYRSRPPMPPLTPALALALALTLTLTLTLTRTLTLPLPGRERRRERCRRLQPRDRGEQDAAVSWMRSALAHPASQP